MFVLAGRFALVVVLEPIVIRSDVPALVRVIEVLIDHVFIPYVEPFLGVLDEVSLTSTLFVLGVEDFVLGVVEHSDCLQASLAVEYFVFVRAFAL